MKSILFLILVCALSGCIDGISHSKAPQTAGRPQSLVFLDQNRLAVGLTHFDGVAYGEGEILLLEPSNGEILSRATTSALNPQSLILHQDALYVVASGQIDLSSPEHPTATTEGAIDRFPIGAFSKSDPIEERLSLKYPLTEEPFVPIGAAFNGEKGIVTSAIRNEVSPIQLDPFAFQSSEAPRIRLDAEKRIGLGSAIAWKNYFILADFNADRIDFLDEFGKPTACHLSLGESERDLEGPQALALIGDQLYVLMALSGSLFLVDLSVLGGRVENCVRLSQKKIVSSVGMTPNHLISFENSLFVTDSGSNRVIEFDASGREVARYPLSVGSNPWHSAISPDGRYLAVSEWGLDAVSIFDRTTKTLVAQHFLSDQPHEFPDAGVSEDGGFRGEGTLAYADLVIDAPGASEARFHDPTLAANGVRGAGEFAGSLDVFSLSATGVESSIVLGWSGGRRLIDGEGPDLKVFENAFHGPRGWYIEPMIVELSIDGSEFIALPYDYLAEDETAYQPEPELWKGFAGINWVAFHEEQNPIDPFLESAGGNAFDLADLPDTELGRRIKSEGALYVRLTAASALINPDSGEPFPIDPDGLGPDIDGIYGRVSP